MIKVEKDFSLVPSILNSQNRKEAFEQNIQAKKYDDENNRYKVGSVQKKLNNIYHLKCAFCEQKLLDSPKHIEHYRPKNLYYWLAYSWDNLLLSCGSCNSSKGDRFETTNDKIYYSNENYENIHNLSISYDEQELPMIINAEKDDVLEYIKYDKSGRVYSENVRVKHTIENACNLNRDELLQKRLPILNDFINIINKHYVIFKKKGDISRFQPDIESFVEKASKENEFYSFRYFIINNINTFFENEHIQKILKVLILKLA